MADTGDTPVMRTIRRAIAVITLNRPEKLNALDLEMILALERAAHRIEMEAGVRVDIITGTGEESFCARRDIAAWSKYSPLEFGNAWIRYGHRAFDALARLRETLIAPLTGDTLGGGLEVAATADFRIAEKHVRIGSPETGLGIIPG